MDRKRVSAVAVVILAVLGGVYYIQMSPSGDADTGPAANVTDQGGNATVRNPDFTGEEIPRKFRTCDENKDCSLSACGPVHQGVRLPADCVPPSTGYPDRTAVCQEGVCVEVPAPGS